MNLNDLFTEEKVRLDPKCWTGKKIGNPKTKVKGGVRVNNCVPAESVEESTGQPLSVQQLATISDAALDDAYGYGRSTPGNTFGWQANMKSAAYAKQMIDQGVTDIEAISDAIHKGWNTTAQAFVQNPDQFDDTAKLAAAGKLQAKLQQRAQLMKQNYAQLPEEEKEKDRVVARALLQAIRGEPQQGMAEGELDEAHHGSLLDHNKGQFASVIFQSQWDTDPQIDYYNNLDDAKFDTENASAHHGSVYAWNGARWVRKMSATERNGSGGGYGSWAENKQGVAEDWQKANKRDRTDGMSQKAVNAYRRENPGSKLKTAVTTKPSKLKKGGKASKRRKSYCSRSRGQMKMHSISCAKTPDKAICKARRRWNC